MNLFLRAVPQVLALLALSIACAKVTTTYSTEASADDEGTGGRGDGTGTGGVQSNGGSPEIASGGLPAYGGTRSSGGSASAFGGAMSGGARASGGATASGSATASGGATVTSSGGVNSSGGATSKGGTSSSGGTSAAAGGEISTAGGASAPSCATGTAAFCDNFEANTVGKAATGWTATGTWTVVADASGTAGSTLVYANQSSSNATAQAGAATYTNASIEVRMRVTSFSSASASNSAGVFLRSNGTNDYDLSLGGDGKIYLRRTTTSSTEETCSSGTSNGNGVPMVGEGTGWFRLKLQVTGTKAAGITITGSVDATGSGTYTQVLQCVQNPGVSYMYDSGSAGLFSKGSAPAEFDDVIITNQ